MNLQDEILTIAQEECGEFVQIVSKVRRFGLDSNVQKLAQEAGDVLCMLELMVENNIVTQEDLNLAKSLKREKLKTWSNIFKNNE
jgi:NTP pyrophosphatase (non-canonical NTP hydrolase)